MIHLNYNTVSNGEFRSDKNLFRKIYRLCTFVTFYIFLHSVFSFSTMH